MNPTEARAKIKRYPKRYRAAVLEGTETPLKEQGSTAVRLFPLVRDADVYLRTRKERLEGRGYEVEYGTFKQGVFRFEHPNGTVRILSIDKGA